MIELEGFDIVDRLGHGGMASVWKARQRSLDRDVAIKFLSANFATTPEDVARFQSEARTAGRLKHPGIVQVYDAIFQQGVYCFVMELVNGYTIGDWVRRKGRLSEREAVDIADCVADALDYAWKQYRMVHCDIKPDNVMVDADGTVKLTDLGLSRTVGALRSSEEATVEEVFGTPAYISPEQAMGEPDLDCRADMYSLGAMLYHLVTGQMLFQGEPNDKVMELQVSAHVPALRTLAPEVSVPFENLVEKLLAKERQYRHADWSQVRADLAAVRYRHPLPNGFPHPGVSTMLPDPNRPAMPEHSLGTLTKEPPAVRSHAVSVLASLVVLGGVVGGVVWYERHRPDSPAPSAGTPAPKPVSRAAALLAQAQDWASMHVTRNDEIIARYQWVVEADPASPEADQARAAIATCQRYVREKCAEVMETLAARNEPLLAEGRYDEAISSYAGYSGPYAAETRTQRSRIVEDMRARRQAHAAQAAADKLRHEEEARRAAVENRQRELEDAAIAELLDTLFLKGIAAAHARAEAMAAESPAGAPGVMATDRVRPFREILAGAHGAEQAVLDSFEERLGQMVELRARTGTVNGKIMQVSRGTGDIVLGRGNATAMVQVKVNLRDLSLTDRLQRMGGRDTLGARLAKTLLCIDQGAYDFARDQVEPLPDPLKQRLLDLIPPGR